MELIERAGTNGTVTLRCECGSSSFRVEFRKSASIRRYEELGAQGHKPDTQVLVCGLCEMEVTITETVAKMPPLVHPDSKGFDWRSWSRDETMQRLAEELRRTCRGEPEEWAANEAAAYEKDWYRSSKKEDEWDPGWPPMSSEDM